MNNEWSFKMQPIFNKRYNSFWFTLRIYDHSLPIQYHGGWPIAQVLLNRIACSLHIPAFRSLESLLIVSMSWIPQLLPFLYIFRSVSVSTHDWIYNFHSNTLFQKHSVCWAVWVPAGLHCDPIRWKKINQAQPLHISVDRLAIPLGIWITRTGNMCTNSAYTVPQRTENVQNNSKRKQDILPKSF